MNWIVFAASLAAVIVLAGVAWSLKLGGPDACIATPEGACQTADDALTGFAATASVVGADGRAALVVDKAGRVAVLKAHGARVAAREVVWSDVRATDAGVVVETRDRRFGAVRLKDVDALAVRRLAPQLTEV